jgi:hypothetical protein
MVIKCNECGREIHYYKSNYNRYTKHYCSIECKHKADKQFNPNIERFQEELWEQPITELAIKYNTSVKTIHKYCKRHNLITPGRGIWQRIAAGKTTIEEERSKIFN